MPVNAPTKQHCKAFGGFETKNNTSKVSRYLIVDQGPHLSHCSPLKDCRVSKGNQQLSCGSKGSITSPLVISKSPGVSVISTRSGIEFSLHDHAYVPKTHENNLDKAWKMLCKYEKEATPRHWSEKVRTFLDMNPRL